MIDETDKKILNILGNNARASLQEIAHQCHLSPAAIHLRVKKLEDQKVIIGSKLILDPIKLGLQTMAFIGVFFEKAGMYKSVKKELELIPEIIECSFTTGNYSLLLKIYCRDNHHLMDVLSNKIQVITGIARTETFICLDQSFERMVVV